MGGQWHAPPQSPYCAFAGSEGAMPVGLGGCHGRTSDWAQVPEPPQDHGSTAGASRAVPAAFLRRTFFWRLQKSLMAPHVSTSSAAQEWWRSYPVQLKSRWVAGSCSRPLAMADAAVAGGTHKVERGFVRTGGERPVSDCGRARERAVEAVRDGRTQLEW